MATVVVLGANGQLASELRTRKEGESSFVFLSKEQIQDARKNDFALAIKQHSPEFIINCTAYTAVDKAETESAPCFDLNRDFVREIAKVNHALGSHLIHFSTDYVFDGTSPRPYAETDPTSPINTYGASKLAGENEIFELGGSATVVRTSWVYSRFGANFVKTMLRLAKTNNQLRVVGDQVGCPTWAGDLAQMTIDDLLKKTGRVDLINYSGEGQVSWHGFAEAIFQVFGQQGKTVVPITTAEFPTPARRPAYSVLSKEKFQKTFKKSARPWRAALEDCAKTWEIQ